jgi:drug/metabolite transporter (DMT)-like permease
MDQQMQNGRRLVWVVVLGAVIVDALTILTYNITIGSDQLLTQLFRFGLTLVLCRFLLRGANWARWVAGILFSLGGLVAALAGIAMAMTPEGTLGLLMLAIGLLFLAFAILLFCVPSVRLYFRASKFQRTY